MTGAPEAVIVGAEIGAGHDGRAEIVVRVRHENGVVGAISLDADVGFRLIAARGAGDISALVGRPWREILTETVLGGS